MRLKQIINMFLILMLVFMVNVNTALAVGGDEHEDDANDDTVTDNDNDVIDKIYSDDEVFGYEKNKDYDITEHLGIQEAIDTASSLPGWTLLILLILILIVVLIFVVPAVFGFNILKSSKAAMNENPVEAAKGIKDAKKINREYFWQVVEGLGCVAIILFFIAFFK